MDTLRTAELLLYLLITAPRNVVFARSQGLLREWTIRTLESLAPAWNDDQRAEVTESFASFVERLRRSFGMEPDGLSALRFTRMDFSVEPDSTDELLDDRKRLISELERIDKLLLDRRAFELAVQPAFRTALPDQRGVVRASALHGDVRAFLSEPGPGALDHDTFARLLARDTGA